MLENPRKCSIWFPISHRCEHFPSQQICWFSSPMQPASFLLFPVKVFPHLFPFLEPPFISSHFSLSHSLPSSIPKSRIPSLPAGFASAVYGCGVEEGGVPSVGDKATVPLLRSRASHGLIMSLVFLTNDNDDSDGNAGCRGLFVSFVVISPLRLLPAWCGARVTHTLFSSVLLFPFSGEGAEPLRSRVFHSNS